MVKNKPFDKSQDKPFFNEVNTKPDFPEMEKELLDWWYKKGIVKKYLSKNKNSKKTFSFLDGPITANNPMGVHHAWGRTYKDLWQRYRNMNGFAQRFQNGFDCQGLWVEVEVEKELGLKNKKDIENLVPGNTKKSIDKFVELCKKRVYKYADLQTEQSKRLGFFMDWDNSYYTLSDENNYMIWHFLQKCQEKGLIYKGRDSVPWCPRCGTAISQHEILTEDYKELTHDALYVEYELHGRSGEYLLIWTTTPWTLPANVACAVDPKLAYVLATPDNGKKKYYLGEHVAKRLSFEILKKLEGKELLGLTYTSPFDHLPAVKDVLTNYNHTVVSSDERILPVSEEEGTGIVHVATGAGTEDFAIGKKENLPVIEVIDEEAVYLKGFGEFSGKNAKKNPQLIIDYLKNCGSLVKKERYKHRYPVCWRCKTELVWRVVDEWYVSMDGPSDSKLRTRNSGVKPLRQQMMDVAKRIRWIPEFGLKRELDWLNNMHDWLVSKKRYWGLALPIWECKKCGNFEVIGSKEELKKRAVEGWEKFNGHTPHRPWVDEVKIKCTKCDAVTSRIPDVGSPWLDAGIVSFSTIAKGNKGTPLYLKDQKQWRRWFPADFITESFPGQFKNWFYSLIAMSTVLENKEPTKTILGFATLFGEDGQPMHKSLGNMIEFNEGADKIGVDVMRWMYMRQNYSDNLLFGYKKADETRRRLHLRLWNIYNFFVTYANADGWSPKRNTKHRTPNTKHNVLDKWILLRLNETIRGVTKFLDDYDACGASGVIEKFVDDLSLWYIRRSRGRVGLSVTNSEDKIAFYETTYFVLTNLSKLLAAFTPYISEMIFKNLTKEESVHLNDWPKTQGTLNTKLILDMSLVRDVVEKAHAERKSLEIPVRQPLSTLYVTSSEAKPGRDYLQLISDEINVNKVIWKKGKQLKVRFDKKITKDLKEEAKARELIRKIQNERRKLGVNISQYIYVWSPWLPKNEKLLALVANKALAKQLKKGKFKVTKAP